MWPLIVIPVLAASIYALLRSTETAQAAPEVGPAAGSMISNISPSAFVALAGGGVAITPATRALLITQWAAAGTVVQSVNLQNGVCFIGPPTGTIDPATGGGTVIDTLRTTASGPQANDVWISTLAAFPSLVAEVISMVSGHLPQMAKNEPVVASSTTQAANLSVPTMVLFCKAGESF